MRFEFATATRIIFGEGTLRRMGELAVEAGSRALVVTGSSEERPRPLIKQLEVHGVEYLRFRVSEEPTVEDVRQGLELARRETCDLIIGFGGGSALDTAKAVAIMLANGGDVYDYLEIIGGGKSFTRPAVPCFTIPTTSGTGAEVTQNAVLESPEHKVKVSLRSPHILPHVALVDPELTYSLPPDVTARTGMDGLTQLIEPFVSNKANPMTDAVCREGMRRAARSLLRAYQNGGDRMARQDMSLASLFSGMALANAKLGAVHGFASPLGGVVGGPHGAICARLLPPVVEVNVRVLQEREPEGKSLKRFDELAQILTKDTGAKAADGVKWIQELGESLAIPPLATYGLNKDLFPVLIDKAAVSSSMQGNPVKLTPEEMKEILEKAL